MTKEKILEVIALYRKKFEKLQIPKQEYPHDIHVGGTGRAVAHCHAMLDKMETFVREGRIEKAFRWLGFVQCAMWIAQLYSLDELKDHSRPDERKAPNAPKT